MLSMLVVGDACGCNRTHTQRSAAEAAGRRRHGERGRGEDGEAERGKEEEEESRSWAAREIENDARSAPCQPILRTPSQDPGPPAGQFAAMGASPLSVCLGPPDFFQLRAPSCLPRPPGGRIDIGCARHGHRTLCINALRLSPPRKHPLRAACKSPCAEGRTGRRTPREQPAAAPRWISARGSRRQDRAKSGLFLFWQARRRRRDSQG